MIRLAVRVSSERAEVVLAELLELAPSGLEEVRRDPDTVEYALYGAPGELPALPELTAAAGGALVKITTTEVADDWHERWRQFHRPVLIEAPRCPPGAQPVPGLRVRPPWEPPVSPAQGGVREIVIDPGQAFGTGAHASTRLCLELLLELAAVERADGPLLDLGTGSGVLAIAAAKLGFRPVVGLDHDRHSVQAASENARVNGAAVEVRRFDLLDGPLPAIADAPPVVCANLLAPLLLKLADRLSFGPRHLIVGGLLSGQEDEVVGALARAGALEERERRASGEWSAAWLVAG